MRNPESGADKTLAAPTPFTTSRLLVGQFAAAAQALKVALKEISGSGLFAPSPNVVMHPLEMIEGGLSEVEERVLRELAIEAGGHKVVVWTGRELSDSEVVEKLRPK